jgi:hypothetical protein
MVQAILETGSVKKKDTVLGDLMDMWIMSGMLSYDVQRSQSPEQMLSYKCCKRPSKKNFFWKSPSLKPYTLQAVQKLATCDKQLRPQLVAQVHTNSGKQFRKQ